MKRILVGGLLAAATLLGGLALANGSAAAVVDNENDQPKPLVCYDQTPFQEWKFKKTVTTPTEVEQDVFRTDFRYAKFTQTRTWIKGTAEVPSKWWNWSPNHDNKNTDFGPNGPAFPNDARGTWQGPHTNGGPDQGTFGTFNSSNGENGRSSWFHRTEGVAGTEGAWSDWGPWTAWGTNKNGGGYVDGWGPPAGDVLEGPAPHGSGNGWERQYRYQKVDERQVKRRSSTTAVR
jgi:hypothetical protein